MGARRGLCARWREILLALASVTTLLLAVEAAARVFVYWRWPAPRIEQHTRPTPTRGRFTHDAELGYALTPGFHWGERSHNSLGFRGPELAPAKPAGGLRVAILGASTAYGDRVEDADTSARQLEAMLAAAFPERPVETLNAGVPGWTSAETLRNLRLRVLDLEPDAAVILDGRNEIFPQLWNGYRDDYAHYRLPGFDVSRSQMGFKRLFRVSHAAMLLITSGGGRLGFSYAEENPLYASIRRENQPTHAELARNAAEPQRTRGFRSNLGEEIRLLRARGAIPVLSTMPFRVERYGSGVIWRHPDILPVLDAAVARNNALIREVARAHGAPLVDAAAELSSADYLVDDCHFNASGERAFARLVFERLGPLLRERAAAAE